MGNGVFGALSGAKVQARHLEIIANNLANVNTTGFKSDNLRFAEVIVRAQPKDYGYVLESEYPPMQANLSGQPASMVKILSQDIDFSSGSMKSTGSDLDVAFEGRGFFKVEKDGENFYSRDGRFSMGSDGSLLHSSGGRVLDEDGSPISISDGGSLQINSEGVIYQNKARVAKLGAVSLPETGSIKKAGYTLFSYNSQNNPPVELGNARMIQGSLEGSNVNAVSEMTKMIRVNRHFEHMNQAVKAYRDLDRRSIEDVGGQRG